MYQNRFFLSCQILSTCRALGSSIQIAFHWRRGRIHIPRFPLAAMYLLYTILFPLFPLAEQQKRLGVLFRGRNHRALYLVVFCWIARLQAFRLFHQGSEGRGGRKTCIAIGCCIGRYICLTVYIMELDFVWCCLFFFIFFLSFVGGWY